MKHRIINLLLPEITSAEILASGSGLPRWSFQGCGPTDVAVSCRGMSFEHGKQNEVQQSQFHVSASG
jgi:hypothetical protein